MKKLNGWQRLWLAVMVIGAPVVVADQMNRSYQADFPTEDGVRARYQDRASAFTTQVINKEAFMRCMYSKAPTPEEVVSKWNEFGEECRIKLGGERWAEASRLHDDMVAQGEAYIKDELPKDQAIAISKSLGRWFGACLLAYFLAFVGVWVGRGFRPQKGGA